MVNTIFLAFVKLDFDQALAEGHFPNASKEAHIRFTLHPQCTFIENWAFARDNNRPIHLYTTETAIVGSSIELNLTSFLINEEARSRAISELLCELETDLKTKESLVDGIISQIDDVVRNNGFELGDEDDKLCWWAIVRLLVSNSHILVEEDLEDDEVMARVMRNYDEELTGSSSCDAVMVPATMEALEGLEKVRMMGEMRCAICLDDIKEGIEVSRLNCLHVLHGDCIRAWLETSHYCPLCRFELPTCTDTTQLPHL